MKEEQRMPNYPLDNITLYKGCKVYSDIRAYAEAEVFHE